MVVFSGTQAASAHPDWKAVPGHNGVFVDTNSIAHHKVADDPSYHCKGSVPSPPAHCGLPPGDTTADIKVDGAIAKAAEFYCNAPGFEVGDVHFGTVGGKEHIIPTDATKLIVCGSSK
jgi:hypothetical protein